MRNLSIVITILALAGCGSVYSTVTDNPSRPLLEEVVTVKTPDECAQVIHLYTTKAIDNSWEGTYHYNSDGTITCTIYRIL